MVDAFNCAIRKITTNAVVTTVAGLAGIVGVTDGLGSQARFFNPYGIAIDHNGNLRISDTYNETIRFVDNPIVVSLNRDAGGDGVVLSWQAVEGDKYRIQFLEGMEPLGWQNLGGRSYSDQTQPAFRWTACRPQPRFRLCYAPALKQMQSEIGEPVRKTKKAWKNIPKPFEPTT